MSRRNGRRASSGRGPFTPLSLGAALLAWYKSPSAGQVSSWADSSGNGHALAGTAVTFNASGAGSNSLPYFSGNGTTTSFLGTWAVSEPLEYIFVASWNETNANATLVDGGSNSNTGRMYWSGTVNSITTDGGGHGVNLAKNAAWSTYDAIFNATSSSLAIGAASSAGNAGANTATGGLTLFQFGNAGGAPVVSGTGIGEFLMVDPTLITAGQRAQAIAYLRTKFGVT